MPNPKTLPVSFLVAASLVAVTAWAAPDVHLSGAGATFPQPLYDKWVAAFGASSPGAKIDYQGIGSGGGIKAITDKTVAFAGSDAPMSKKEIEAAGGADALLQVPTCAGGVVPVYNVPGLAASTRLKLSGDVLADIFLGKITMWNDPRLMAMNAGVALPPLAITPVWRTDGSGTTFVFSSWLAGHSPAFASTIGTGKQVAWPVGQGGKGNPGVAAAVQQTAGSLGYVELNFATANKLAFAAVKNKSGAFVVASPTSIAAAAEVVAPLLQGTSLTTNLWHQDGAAVYPIASFTYVIVYKDLRNLKSADEAATLAAFLWWAAHDGQKLATAMDYAPLSPTLQSKVELALRQLTFQGRPVLGGAT